MPRCSGVKPSGEQCGATVEPPQKFCWWHDPRHAEQRSRAASKAARSKPSKELRDVKLRLSALADDVLAGRVERGDAAVASQVLNVFLRAVAIEQKQREQEEFAERLAALEAAAGARERTAAPWR
jgi:glutathione S-transferase